MPDPVVFQWNLGERRVLRLLFAALAVLLLLHLVVVFGHLVLHARMDGFTMLFDVDREGNVPTLFNVLLFMAAGFLFLLAGSGHDGRARWPWYLMAAIMAFLAVDEGSQVHERFMIFTLRLLGHGEVRVGEMGWLFYAWFIPYVAVFTTVLLLLLPWLWRLPARLRARVLIGGVLYVAGAVVLEAYSGKLAEDMLMHYQPEEAFPWLPCEAYPVDQCLLYADPLYVGIYTVEEVLEMAGLILCIGALVHHLGERRARLSVTFQAGNGRSVE